MLLDILLHYYSFAAGVLFALIVFHNRCKVQRRPKQPKIKKIKGVKPDLAMTEKIRSGQVPYGYKPAQLKNDGKIPQARYVPCTRCSGMALVKGRLESRNGWRGLACYCKKCDNWCEGRLSDKDREEDAISYRKRQCALHREASKLRKYENSKK